MLEFNLAAKLLVINRSLKEVLMNKKGFTLIELLIVVAIIGIIAAIAIPNLLVALQKGKQKATMGDMKSIGTAVESYITDWSFAPKAQANALNTASNGLVPFHIKLVPTTDGWGTGFSYVYGAGEMQDLYTVQSYGRGGTAQNDPDIGSYYECTTITDFNNDIVFANGSFVYGPRSKK
jgi:type II secretion system protein G